jgi:hypothetical protein
MPLFGIAVGPLDIDGTALNPHDIKCLLNELLSFLA